MLAGRLSLWREGFYLPLVAVSLALSLHAFDPRLRYRWPAGAVAGPCAGERAQPAAARADAGAPAHASGVPSAATLVLLTRRGGLQPVPGDPAGVEPRRRDRAVRAGGPCGSRRNFVRILDDIGQLYNHPQSPAWGLYLTLAGLGVLALVGWFRQARYADPREPTMQVGLMTNPPSRSLTKSPGRRRHGFTVVDVEMTVSRRAESTDWRAVGAAAREHSACSSAMPPVSARGEPVAAGAQLVATGRVAPQRGRGLRPWVRRS
ncbi:MAG: hypothetical protein R2851_09295 [Caldilineaceae bacterium]